MKKYLSPFILLTLLCGGITLIFIRVLTLDDQSGSLGLFIELFYWLSLLIFISSLLLLVVDFKKNKKSFLVWFHLIISAPLSLIIISNFIQIQYRAIIKTTTPKSFLVENNLDSTYLNILKKEFESIPDSLVNKVIGTRSDSTLRYFYGTTYNDDIDRKLSINLTPENKGLQYLEFRTQEIYPSPLDSNYFVGVLTSKYYNEYAVSSDNPDGIDFKSNIFIGSKKNKAFNMIVLNQYNLSCSSFDNCLEHMKTDFLKGRSKTFGYNINDTRFWTENNWIERIDSHSRDLEENIFD